MRGFKAMDEQKVSRPSTRLGGRHCRQREQGPRFRDGEAGWKWFNAGSGLELQEQQQGVQGEHREVSQRPCRACGWSREFMLCSQTVGELSRF